MNVFERRKKIIEKLDSDGSLLVSDIAATLGVTEVTVRNDLSLLEQRGLLTRFHGGAARLVSRPGVAEPQPGGELSIAERYQLAADPKKRIAMAAVTRVREGDTVILDSGSTTRVLAEQLVEQDNITVITNNLPAALILMDNPSITVVVCGGTLRHKTVSLHGSIAEFALRGVSARVMFVGADGLDVENGITTFNEGYAISAAMAAVAEEVVVVTDASKFGRKGFNVVLPLAQIDTIITDDAASPEAVAILQQQGKQVVLV